MTKLSRAKGTGSIEEKTAGKKYVVKWPIGTKPDGSPKHKSKTVWGTRKQAEQYLRERIAERQRATYVQPSKLTVNEHLDEWLTTMKGSLGVQTHKEPELGVSINERKYLLHVE
jgi:hypothetical protein